MPSPARLLGPSSEPGQCHTQVALVLRWLRHRLDLRLLARDAGISIATATYTRKAQVLPDGMWGPALSDRMWARIEPLMPVASATGARPFSKHRQVVEAIIWRYRTGAPWRELPTEFGPWQTVWRRHDQFRRDGTWDAILAAVVTEADDADPIDWAIRLDSTVNRAHQHSHEAPA
ncbi:IS5 family transposase [Mycobacterium syngnathidarum]